MAPIGTSGTPPRLGSPSTRATCATAERRRFVLDVLEAGIAAGTVAPATDVDLIADLLAGPVLYRRLTSRSPLGPAYADRLGDALLPLLAPPSPTRPPG